MKKYNRTFHLPCSQEVHDDDKSIETVKDLLNIEVVLTEKLDGGNACVENMKIFARTHAVEAAHPSFSMMRLLVSSLNGFFPEHLKVFGENMQGIHSIIYNPLSSPFFIFNIFDKEQDIWLSWDEVISFSEKIGIPNVPEIKRGIFKTEKELFSFINDEMKKPSLLGGEREGIVVRRAESFNDSNFETFVGKSVRKGHVQTDEHWSTNWKQAEFQLDWLNKILEKAYA